MTNERPKVAPHDKGRFAYVRWWYEALRAEGCSAWWAHHTASALASTYWWSDGKAKWPDVTSTHEAAQQEQTRARADA